MTISVAQQAAALAQAAALGLAVGLLYDLFRVLRVRVARGIFLQHGIPALALRGVQRQRVEHTPRRDQVGRGAYFLLRQGQIGGRQLIVIATAGVAAGVVAEEGVDLFLALAVLVPL